MLPVDAWTLLVDTLKSAVEREDIVAERFDSKTRQLLALVGVFFTIVQTVAFTTFRQGSLHGVGLVWTISLALGSIGLLAVAALASFRQQAALKVADFNTDALGELVTKAEKSETGIPEKICADYLTLLHSRRSANYDRANRYQLTLLLSSVTLVVTAAELIVALAVRIP